jgi:methylmalonyl-CoA/ethylmalonyl-CoA epimerase
MSDPVLHHIGYVVPSIPEAIQNWARSLAATRISEVFEDPIQQVHVAFLDLPGPGAAQVELVTGLGPKSPVARLQSQGGGLHHLCFLVDDLEGQIAAMKREKALLIRSPVPAVAFEGRRIAWMMTRERLLVEYLEREKR